jgi:hypothetical protein
MNKKVPLFLLTPLQKKCRALKHNNFSCRILRKTPHCGILNKKILTVLVSKKKIVSGRYSHAWSRTNHPACRNALSMQYKQRTIARSPYSL